MAFDFVAAGSDVRDVTEVMVANSRVIHLAPVATGGGIYPDTVCGEQVKHGITEAVSDPDFCSRCQTGLAKAFPDGADDMKQPAVAQHLVRISRQKDTAPTKADEADGADNAATVPQQTNRRLTTKDGQIEKA